MTARTHGTFTAQFAWPAPAKLNLFLHIIGRRADGYHLLQTLFQFIDFCDHLYITPRGDGVITRRSNSAAPEHAELSRVDAKDDLVVRAAQRLSRAAGAGLGADIVIDKHIPIGAGLGGGSSCAATTLVALNRLWNLGFTVDELASLGAHLGADVPVFVRGYAAWAEGIGERLTRAQPPTPWYVLIIAPVKVSTAALYAAPELPRDCAPLTLDVVSAGAATRNVFEPLTRARHPDVGAALDWLSQFGAARMTGTGAAVFLAATDEARARAIAAQCPSAWRSVVAAGLNRSPLLDAAIRS